MKNGYLVSIFLVLFLEVVYSQEWYPIGATWYYNSQSMESFPAHGYRKYTVIKDTLVEEKLCKLITYEAIEYTGKKLFSGNELLYEQNSKVYFYRKGVFSLMYDFTLNVGDTLLIEISRELCDSVSPMVVDSIKEFNINGKTLRNQYISCTYYIKQEYGGYSYTKTYSIIERIGHSDFCNAENIYFIFQPFCPIEDGFLFYEFRCYEDYEVSYTGCSWGKRFQDCACDTLIDGSTGIYEKVKKLDFTLYPNPANERLFIDLGDVSGKAEVAIADIMDRIVYSSAVGQGDESRVEIDTRRFPAGIYFIRFSDRNASAGAKFIIAR